jgi:hypothetical protein
VGNDFAYHFRHSSDEKKLIRKALKKNFVFLTTHGQRSQALVAAEGISSLKGAN